MLRAWIMAALFMMLSTSLLQAQENYVEKITGDVYRFQNEFHYSIFVITNEGVVVTDPINFHAARWLKGEISKLTDKPITHLVYSHSHADHASGGKAFGEVPNVVAHANAPEKIDGVSPTQRFDDTLDIKIGDKTLELTYLGPGHGKDLIAMVVRPENVGFIVDAAGVSQLPYRNFPDSNVDDMVDQIRKIESLEFDVFAGGHGPLGVKADATDVRIYIEKLREQVLAGLKEGKSVSDLKKSITMDEYKSWGWTYNWRAENIQGMARHLKAVGEVN